MSAKTKTNNRLWQIRHQLEFQQKQVARLLGHKTCDQISRYDRGDRMPSLKTALKLEIILRVPIREMFPELYENLRAEIVAKVLPAALALASGRNDFKNQTGAHICTFETLVLQRKPAADDLDLVRQHSIKLMRELTDAINRQ